MDQAALANARSAIENLLYSYAERIDSGDFAGIGDLFAKGRMLAPGGELIGTGREEIMALYERSTKRYEDGSPMTQHLTTNLILDVAGNGRTAEGRSRFMVMQSLPDFPLQCIISGDYEDRFALDDSVGWYFTERCMKPRFHGDLSRHLQFDDALLEYADR